VRLLPNSSLTGPVWAADSTGLAQDLYLVMVPGNGAVMLIVGNLLADLLKAVDPRISLKNIN